MGENALLHCAQRIANFTILPLFFGRFEKTCPKCRFLQVKGRIAATAKGLPELQGKVQR
jgi:hypothetical protein